MKTVDKYLVAASHAILSTGIAKDNKIPKAYKGAVSSFGASLIMSGLIPTIQFYMGDSSNRDSEHEIIIEAIAKILYTDGRTDAKGLKTKIMALLEIQNPRNQRILVNNMKMKIVDAAIALKIMMRSYQFSDNESAE